MFNQRKSSQNFTDPYKLTLAGSLSQKTLGAHSSRDKNFWNFYFWEEANKEISDEKKEEKEN